MNIGIINKNIIVLNVLNHVEITMIILKFKNFYLSLSDTVAMYFTISIDENKK